MWGAPSQRLLSDQRYDTLCVSFDVCLLIRNTFSGRRPYGMWFAGGVTWRLRGRVKEVRSMHVPIPCMWFVTNHSSRDVSELRNLENLNLEPQPLNHQQFDCRRACTAIMDAPVK
jgi:hypothetical protein